MHGLVFVDRRLILRPLPVRDPHQLVNVVHRAVGDDADAAWFNYPLFERMRSASRSYVQLFGMSMPSRRDAVFDDGGGQPEKVYAQWISGDAMEILGVKPALGRLFTASDDQRPGQHPVAVISHDFWIRRFAGSPIAIGRWVTLREKQLQIVGIAERGFTGVEPGLMTDVWAPNMMWDDRAISEPGWSWFRVWGRLQPDVRPEEARAVLQTVSANFRRERAAKRPADESREQLERYINAPLHVRSAANGRSELRISFGRALWILGVVAALVLLVACANVASLLTARTAARGREMALRISIGAGRGRLIQQVLIESALISLMSCLTGALLALYLARFAVSLLSSSVSVIRLDVGLDWRMLAFVAATGTVVTVLFGLAPALRASTTPPGPTLKSGSGRETAKKKVFGPLIAAQTAFGFIVLFISGLFLASFVKLIGTDLGFDRDQVVVVNIEYRDLRQSGPETLAVWRQMLEQVGELPGIESAGLATWSLFEGSTSSRSVRIPGRPVEAFEPFYLPVSPGFFETMRIRLVDGRAFDWRDVKLSGDSPVVVNQSFARRYFPGEHALGKRFSYVGRGNALVSQEIVGIVQDAKYASVRQAAPPTVYLPQLTPGWTAVQLRTKAEPAAVAARLRQELPRIHPSLRIVDVTLQSTLVDNALVRERALALISGFFSVVAIILVTVGLYGTLSYTVLVRTREIGIRLALGARPMRVAGLMLTEVGILTTIGLAVGIAGGLAGSRYITTLLYQVLPTDVTSLGLPVMSILAAAAFSALVPALRALRVDPVETLRRE